jgi:hypothetical protein
MIKTQPRELHVILVPMRPVNAVLGLPIPLDTATQPARMQPGNVIVTDPLLMPATPQAELHNQHLNKTLGYIDE